MILKKWNVGEETYCNYRAGLMAHHRPGAGLSRPFVGMPLRMQAEHEGEAC